MNVEANDSLFDRLSETVVSLFHDTCVLPPDKQLTLAQMIQKHLSSLFMSLKHLNGNVLSSHEAPGSLTHLIQAQKVKQEHHSRDKKDFVKKKKPGRSRVPAHICQYCHKVFRRPYSLRDHISLVHNKTERDPTSCQCEECGRIFKTAGGLNGHRQRYHNIGREVFHCPKCTYATFKRSLMEGHLERYHGPNHKRNSVCEICGKGFTKNSQLKLHLETHSQNKIYSCDQCQFTSRTLAGLRSHKYSQHNPNARSYHCEHCSKRWRKRLYYKAHMEKHHGVHIQPSKTRKGPQPVCGDAVIRERAAVAIAVESMATLSQLPDTQTDPLVPDPKQEEKRVDCNSEATTLYPSTITECMASRNIPAVPLTSHCGTTNPLNTNSHQSSIPLPVFCVQIDEHEQSMQESKHDQFGAITLQNMSDSVSLAISQSGLSHQGEAQVNQTANDSQLLMLTGRQGPSVIVTSSSSVGKGVPLQFQPASGVYPSTVPLECTDSAVSDLLNQITQS